MRMGRRAVTPLAMVACALLLVSVFIPWVTGAAGSAAGWGFEAHPQVRGMLVIACAMAALALLGSNLGGRGLRRRVLAEVAAAVLLAALIAVSSVVADPGSYAGRSSAVLAGAWLALVVLVVGIAASLAEALVPGP